MILGFCPWSIGWDFSMSVGKTDEKSSRGSLKAEVLQALREPQSSKDATSVLSLQGTEFCHQPRPLM